MKSVNLPPLPQANYFYESDYLSGSSHTCYQEALCVLIVCCNTRIAAASGPGALGPAAIHADTGLSFSGPATWGFWLPSHTHSRAGHCLHLQALEEIWMSSQVTEQGIISIGLNSS